MAKGKKKEKFPYKFLRVEELNELRKLSTEKLFREQLKENKDLKALKRQKKDDPIISDLDKQIKEHREKATTDEHKRELLELKDRVKEIKAEIDQDIQELLEDRKAEKKGWNDALKPHKEKIEAILKIIEEREG